MKRGTPRHPKVAHLAELLKTRVPTAIGYLELLWHFTAEFAPQGDIGRYSDARIEGAILWSGGRGKLIAALLQAVFIEPHGSHRLVVHDWHDHADDAVKKRLARADLKFLSITPKVTGQQPDFGGQSQTTADNGSLPEPSLSHGLSQCHTPTASVHPVAITDEHFAEFTAAFRENRPDAIPEDFQKARVSWNKLDGSQRIQAIDNVKAMTASGQQIWCTVQHFLFSGEYKRPPKPTPPRATPGRLTAEDIARL